MNYIKGLILNEKDKVYSKFLYLFKNIIEFQKDYNWLISDIECYPITSKYQNIFNDSYLWMSGEELYNILKYEDFQWIWAVFSGFKKNIKLEEILKQELPYANGYKGFWSNPLSIQHTLADIEIVAWDSICSIFICNDDKTIKNISKIYLNAKDLENYNLEK